MVNKLKFFAYAGIAFLFLTSLTHNAGYWHKLGINTIPYMNFWDIIKLAIFEITFPAFLLFIVLVILFAFSLHNKNISTNSNNIYKSWFNKFLLCFFFILGIITLGWTAYVNGPIIAWIYGGILTLFSPVIVILVYYKKIPYKLMHLIIGILIFFCPLFTFALGEEKANTILNNKQYEKISFSFLKNRDNKVLQYKYLGTLGDKYFLMTLDNKKVLITQLNTKDFIEFERR